MFEEKTQEEYDQDIDNLNEQIKEQIKIINDCHEEILNLQGEIDSYEFDISTAEDQITYLKTQIQKINDRDKIPAELGTQLSLI